MTDPAARHHHGGPHGAHSAGEPLPDTIEAFDQAFWDDRYRSRPTLWSGRPNLHLVEQAGDLPVGRALDLGAGEGADALWLAARGWMVTAVDISPVALDRGRTAAGDAAAGADGVVTWMQADLLEWRPPVGAFDLVSAQYVHFPSADRPRVFRAWVDAVAPGGSLLVVGHHPSDLDTAMPRPNLPDLFFVGADLTGLLDAGRWEVVTDEAAPRVAATPDGDEVTIHDTVVRAVRRG